jgi:hypothetical protein
MDPFNSPPLPKPQVTLIRGKNKTRVHLDVWRWLLSTAEQHGWQRTPNPTGYLSNNDAQNLAVALNKVPLLSSFEAYTLSFFQKYLRGGTFSVEIDG